MATRTPTKTPAKRAASTSPRSPGRSPGRATSTRPRTPGRSPGRATSTRPRTPGRSPTRGGNGYSSNGSGKRSKQPQANEHLFSRALQGLFLIGAVLLLLLALFGAKGPVLIGVGVFLSAFPPARRYVDRWLVGTSKGEEADEAAILRIAAGAGIVILALILAPG